MLDPDGNVITWNTGAEKIKGYSAEEIIGKNFASFYTADDVAAGKPQRNLREATRGLHSRSGTAQSAKMDRLSKRKLSLPRCATRTGKIRGFSKVTRDITDQIRSREV